VKGGEKVRRREGENGMKVGGRKEGRERKAVKKIQFKILKNYRSKIM
jgi:hypothetical protein